MRRINLMKLYSVIFLLFIMFFLVSCNSKQDEPEIITEAKIIEIDAKSNTLIVSGKNKFSINQIGDKCIIYCKRVKLFGEAGEDVDIEDFRVDDNISIMSDGIVEESYPTKIVNVEWVQLNNEE
ncbi:MAG: hypothetical protein RR844_01980 [Clostridium sp.]